MVRMSNRTTLEGGVRGMLVVMATVDIGLARTGGKRGRLA
jgi:hypothetical protein